MNVCPSFRNLFEALHLPDPADFSSELEWLGAVQDYLSRAHGIAISYDTLYGLWCLAGEAVAAMGDIFFDPDEYSEFCYGCPDSGSGRCDGRYEYSEDENHRCCRWYGNTGTARLLGLAAVPVLKSLIVVWAAASYAAVQDEKLTKR